MKISKIYKVKNAVGRCATKGCMKRIECYIDADLEKDGKTIASMHRKHICFDCLREFLTEVANG
jgi:hypothetical protein